MAQPTKQNDHGKKKRVIEFDMFVRDVEPEEGEQVRGGSGSGKAQRSADDKDGQN
jgi:hypothetical protein